MDTYNRPALLKEAVSALFRQTYDNLEIILVNNGATPETVEYLYEVAALDKRVKLVHFKENQYSPDDPLKMCDVCPNAALREARGDYIWYQADDDWIADDYADKMVRLFVENPECITAAGLPVPVEVHGDVLDNGPRKSNLRPRYMPGHELALDHLRGGRMYGAPGTIFTFRREALIKAGGFHRAMELSHLFGIVPFGVTGFDETALFYWRRHDGQLNKQLSANGKIGTRATVSLLREWEIERRWQVFGVETAREVVAGLEQRVVNSAASWFTISLSYGRFAASQRIARGITKAGHGWQFWRRVPGEFRRRWRELLFYPVKVVGKRVLRLLFGLLPATASLPPWLQSLRIRVTGKG